MPTCFLCKETVHSINGLLTHFNVKHYINSFTVFKCGENGCNRVWSSWNSLRKHLLGSNHNFSLWPTALEPVQSTNIEIINESVIHHTNTNISETVSLKDASNEDLLITATDYKSLVKSRCDAFVAKLYYRSSIPRNHIQSIIEDSTLFLTSGCISMLKEKVLLQLNALGSDNQTIQDITSMFDTLENPFHHIRNEYQRMEYFKCSGNYIAPVEYCIGKKKYVKILGHLSRSM